MIDELFHEFLINWKTQKEVLEHTLKENRKWNAEFRLQNQLNTKDKFYKNNKKTLEVKNDPVVKILLEKIPQEIYDRASLLKNEYLIDASVGKGQISEIPWLCIFDLDITNSAERGYYIGYLMKSDMSGFYLTLNQGWTQYEKAYGSNARVEAVNTSKRLKRILKNVSGFNFYDINLKGKSPLAKGYEYGTICSKYYSVNSIPDSKTLINDLQKLIGAYRELKAFVGLNVLDIGLVLEEEEFQSVSQIPKMKILEEGKIKLKKKVSNSITSSWLRDPSIANLALEIANFKCENDPFHETFISYNTQNQFVEAHHLIPMEFQGEFDYSIDVPENIISLCPNCHRAFHNSVNSVKKELISKFFNSRKDGLKGRGINLNRDKLFKYYKISDK